jgi:hypothetical protein
MCGCVDVCGEGSKVWERPGGEGRGWLAVVVRVGGVVVS